MKALNFKHVSCRIIPIAQIYANLLTVPTMRSASRQLLVLYTAITVLVWKAYLL